MRHFAFAALLAASVSVTGCATAYRVPVFDAEANRTLKLPDELGRAGTQAKIRMPGEDGFILIWRTEIGFGGSELCCSHCRRELSFNWDTKTLDCPSGIRYRLDGSFLDGQLRQGEKVDPLKAYLVDLDGNRLRILG